MPKFSAVKCLECGKYFTPIRSNNVRCSKDCRTDYKIRFEKERNERLREARLKARPEKICKHCGVIFKPVNPARVFCTVGCRAIFERLSKPEPKPLPKNWAFPEKREILPADLTTDLADEIRRYKEAGGVITTLPAEVTPATPSVGVQVRGGSTGSEWSASALAGMGEYEDPWENEES